MKYWLLKSLVFSLLLSVNLNFFQTLGISQILNIFGCCIIFFGIENYGNIFFQEFVSHQIELYYYLTFPNIHSIYNLYEQNLTTTSKNFVLNTELGSFEEKKDTNLEDRNINREEEPNPTLLAVNKNEGEAESCSTSSNEEEQENDSNTNDNSLTLQNESPASEFTNLINSDSNNNNNSTENSTNLLSSSKQSEEEPLVSKYKEKEDPRKKSKPVPLDVSQTISSSGLSVKEIMANFEPPDLVLQRINSSKNIQSLIHKRTLSEEKLKNNTNNNSSPEDPNSEPILKQRKSTDTLTLSKKACQHQIDSKKSSCTNLNDQTDKLITSSSNLTNLSMSEERKRKQSLIQPNREIEKEIYNVSDLKEELSVLEKKKRVKSTLGRIKKYSSQNFILDKLDWSITEGQTPNPLGGHTATPYGNAFLLIGGVEVPNEVHFFDPVKQIWKNPKMTGTKSIPATLHGHTSERIGSKFYIIGGAHEEGKLSDKVYVVSVIDDETVHWSIPRISGNSPSPRIGHSSSRYRNQIIVFGGFDGKAWLSDLYILNLDDMSWDQPSFTGAPPPNRTGHSATLVDNKLIIFGGMDSTQEYNDLHYLDLDTMTWYQVDIDTDDRDNIPGARSFHSATRVGKNLFMQGGKRGTTILRDFWMLSVDLFIWTKLIGNQAPPRYYHTIERLGSELILIGGKGPQNQIASDIWKVNTVQLPLSAQTPHIEYLELNVKHEIGVGNFSRVYKGFWKGKEVAIKKLNPKKNKDQETNLKEFKSEVEILGSLSHPNLVTLFGYCSSPMCLVMEYLPKTLYDLIHTQKIDSDLLLQFAVDVASGMDYLHKKDILHRDLKSSNILLDKHLNVKIADLGIARQKTGTSTMTTIGTVAWTAPEILRHERYNEKCDVYSYSIVLWECLTAKIPYEDMTAVNAGIAVASHQLRPELKVEEYDKNWCHLIQWAWKEDPKQRPSFDEILTFLKNTF